MTYLCFCDQLVHEVAKVSLVLCLVVELLAAHLGNVGLWVPSGAQELLELCLLCRVEAEIFRGELHHDLALCRVVLAHICGVSETEALLRLRGLKRPCQFC